MQAKIRGHWLALAAIALSVTHAARADEVTDWNRNMLQAVLAGKASPLVTSRDAAIVQTAVFDAVNGIERRYTAVHVDPAAPKGASQRAAAVQAAYATLVNLFPSQKSTFDAELVSSIAAIASDVAAEKSESIARGMAWGQSVADAILAWRSTDGFTPPPPPFVGGFAVGEWRPTPPAFMSGAGPQFAYMTPWAINSPSQFRPAGPPALNSTQYTAVFNETKSMGSISSASRTADQTLYSQFWATSTPVYNFDHLAVSLGAERHLTLSENARLLALLNIAIADAVIACWDAKYYYVFWRPITAISLAATDGNPDTIDDPTWTPLIVTPPHPEYPSGHSTVSSAAATVLSNYFGENTSFSVDSDVMLGVVRSFTSFSAAVDEVTNARVFAGIHFRTACNDGRAIGAAVASYVLANSLRPVNGNHEGQIQH
jgi:membrane-associated phospholipid phosphatase